MISTRRDVITLVNLKYTDNRLNKFIGDFKSVHPLRERYSLQEDIIFLVFSLPMAPSRILATI
ncbi:hypothetical protein Avbf_16796 [Armadillidium vulgare]|nr:hypothetical protein Avbf_16796 [Armadillidium vulgare]